MSDPRATKRNLAIFVGALIGVPLVALAILIHETATDTPDAVAEVVLPAALGTAAGVVVVLLLARRQVSSDGTASRPQRAAVGSAVIAGAAVVGTFSDLLPRMLDSFLTGFVLGYFVGFGYVLIKLWRDDPAFRRRIRSAR